nr:DUF2550 domain-containing protein [Lolliginicoccus lacisalsi]
MVLALILLLLILAVAAFAYRLVQLRAAGAGAVIRALPAKEGLGWRYGVIRYRDEDLNFYRLSRMIPGPSLRIDRQDAEVSERRAPTKGERDLLDPGSTVIRGSVGEDDYEFAFDRDTLTAFLSWLESRPPRRARRRTRWTPRKS